MSPRMEELLDSYQTRIEVYENTKNRPADDHYMWESIQMAREAVLQETEKLVSAIEHMKICRTCAEGSLEDCLAGREIERLLKMHKELKTTLRLVKSPA